MEAAVKPIQWSSRGSAITIGIQSAIRHRPHNRETATGTRFSQRPLASGMRSGLSLPYGSSSERTPLMHYPRRISNIKRVRKLGFRARMKTRLGRKMINRKRRLGRRLAAA